MRIATPLPLSSVKISVLLALEPTDTLVKRFSARVSTMIRNVQVLREFRAHCKTLVAVP